MSNRGKIVKKSATVKVPMIARGPVVRPIVVDALHNPSNLRDRDPDPDPEEDQRSSQNGQSTGRKIFVVPQYQLAQEPMLTSVSYSVLFFNGL